MVPLGQAVFLDRDGVVNRAVVRGDKLYSPMSVDEFEFETGAEDAVRRIAAYAPVVVVTNQPEVARGRLAVETLEAMHALIRVRLPVTDVVFCPHDNADACECRKPKPGMILDACARLGVDPGLSVMVGDQDRDIEAGRAAGCRTVLISNRPDRHQIAIGHPGVAPDHRNRTLAEAVPSIIKLLGGELP